MATVGLAPRPYPYPASTLPPGGQPPPSPTFQPPAQDPRLSKLFDAMGQPLAAPTAPNVAGPDFSGIQAKSKQLSDLMSSLMAGNGPSIGSVSGDPEAVAYRTAALRSQDAQRQSEADRLGASGVSGSGDFDARLAQINEATGENIGNFEGALAGRKKQEALQAATTGANLELADLGRQTSAVQSTYDAAQHQADFQATREDSARAMDAQRQTALLNALLGNQQMTTETAFRTADEGRAEAANTRADAAERRAQQEFNQTPAGKIAASGVAPPNAYFDPRRGWVQLGSGSRAGAAY